MSETNIDPNDETLGAIERLLPKAVRELEELIETGGKRTVNYRCAGCGKGGSVEAKMADADLIVKAVSTLSSARQRIQSKDDTTSRRASVQLSDLHDMTSAELAEYIADLESQLQAGTA